MSNVLSDLKYPLAIDNVSGNLVLVSESDVRKQNIKSLLETLIQERIMRPDYGTPLYLFDTVDNVNLISFKIKKAIIDNVPDVDCEVISTLNSQGHLNIVINWIWLEQPNIPNTPINLNIEF